MVAVGYLEYATPRLISTYQQQLELCLLVHSKSIAVPRLEYRRLGRSTLIKLYILVDAESPKVVDCQLSLSGIWSFPELPLGRSFNASKSEPEENSKTKRVPSEGLLSLT